MTAIETEARHAPERLRDRAERAAREDRRLVQGQGVFFDDIKRKGMGYLHFVRSPYAACGDLGDRRLVPRSSCPACYGTLTGAEVAILTDPFFQIAAPPGANVKDYALAVGKVRYTGEPVVAVVADTRERARDAAELVVVDYEPFDPVVDARAALADGAPVLHEECGGNLPPPLILRLNSSLLPPFDPQLITHSIDLHSFCIRPFRSICQSEPVPSLSNPQSTIRSNDALFHLSTLTPSHPIPSQPKWCPALYDEYV